MVFLYANLTISIVHKHIWVHIAIYSVWWCLLFVVVVVVVVCIYICGWAGGCGCVCVQSVCVVDVVVWRYVMVHV